MGWYLAVILGYLLVLAAFNFIRARQIKSQEDFMVAGRQLSLTVMVFTLICTWIGSGTFIAGAEYAARAGWSSLWQPAGAWVGIAVIYFLAAKIRTFGQYTVGDILEVRYGKFARLFGALALIVSFTTIVSYQFRAGGYILNVATDGAISVPLGQTLAALFVIVFTALGGMVAVAHTDLPNGIIIVLACCAAVPLAILGAGAGGAAAALPAQHFAVFAADFGKYPALKAGSYFLATLLLLMGVQSMYQKFYSAKSPGEARRAVGLWILGTILVETVVIVIAVHASAAHWVDLKAFQVGGQIKEEVLSGKLEPGQALARSTELARDLAASAQVKPEQLGRLELRLHSVLAGDQTKESIAALKVGIDPTSIVLQAARDIGRRGGIVGLAVGLLLLGAACSVVISTGMNYLLSPSTNIMRDIYQRFLKPEADQKTMVALQKVIICLLGLAAFLMIWVPTVLGLRISVLKYAYFAYTVYGVGITPALLAALTWKRATRAGGVASIVLGSLTVVLFDLVIPNLFPAVIQGEDPWGIPSIYPAALVSIGALILVSLFTTPPTEKDLAPLFKKA